MKFPEVTNEDRKEEQGRADRFLSKIHSMEAGDVLSKYGVGPWLLRVRQELGLKCTRSLHACLAGASGYSSDMAPEDYLSRWQDKPIIVSETIWPSPGMVLGRGDTLLEAVANLRRNMRKKGGAGRFYADKGALEDYVYLGTFL